MKKIILTLVSFLFLIVLVLLILPSFIDWSKYKDQITSQIANASGYQVEIGGEMKAAFLPYPHVILNMVSFDSADVEGPVSFEGQVESVSVALSIMPLLSGTIAVSDVTLVSPNIQVGQQDYAAPTETPDNESSDTEDGSAAPAIQLDRFYIEDANITYTTLDGEPMAIGFPVLQLKADTLFGPYTFEGSVVYNDLSVDFDGKAGAYSTEQPISLAVNIGLDSLSFTYSGLIDMTKEMMGFQGEINADITSLQALASQFGGGILPIQDQNLFFSGLITGTPQAVNLENGSLALGDTKGDVKLSASGLDSETKTITANIDLTSALNIDDILTLNTNNGGRDSNASPSGNEEGYAFLPDTIEIPFGLNATLGLTAPAIIYNGEALEAITAGLKLQGQSVEADINVGGLPGGGSVDATANLVAESTSRNSADGAVIFANPALSVNGNFTTQSLKIMAADWLEVVEDSIFDSPQIPKSAQGEIRARVQGAKASISSPSLSLGQYDIRGLSLSYTNAATPKIDLAVANFESAKIQATGTLDQSQGVKVSVSHPNAAEFIKVFNPNQAATPALQHSVSFNGTILQNGDAITVNEMQAKIGDLDASGNLTIIMGEDIPELQADLTFGVLDTRALMGGQASAGAASNTAARSTGIQSASSPWTRDAIDTSFLRTMTLDLDARARQLIHGPWVIDSPVFDLNLSNGVLDITNISGDLFEGKVELKGRVEAREEAQPLSVDIAIDVDNVDLNNLVQAALAQSIKRVDGTGSFNMDLQTSGLSSSALIFGLNGDGAIETSDLILYGIDLAKVTEALSDESLSDLATVVQGAFRSGQTGFQPVAQPLIIREGTMPVNDFKLVSETAQLIANGEVSFARWQMDLDNTVDFIGQYDDLPSVEIGIKGPLNAPQQNVASDVLRSFLVNKYGNKVRDKIQDAIGDKLGEDSPATGLINNLLGLPQQQPKQAPVENDNAAPEPQAETAPEASTEEKLIRGLLGQFGR